MKSPTSARRVSQTTTAVSRALVEPLDARQLLSASAGGFRDVHATNTYTPKTINLRYYVGDASLEGTVVDAKYDVGTVRIGLLDKTAPLSTANFLKYVDAGKYNGTFVDRSIAGFVVQGGGFTFSDTSGVSQVTTYPAVTNEFHTSNTRGTIAFAKLGNQPNSATNEFFYNTGDNSSGTTGLDTQNGGFTVFAKVIGAGLTVVDKINALTTIDASTAFMNLPVQNYDGTSAVKSTNLVQLESVTRVPTVTGTTLGKVTASSNKQSIVTTKIQSGKLILTYSKTKTGTATITVNATGVDGSVATTTFKVRVVASTTPASVQPAPAASSSDVDKKKHDVASDVLI